MNRPSGLNLLCKAIPSQEVYGAQCHHRGMSIYDPWALLQNWAHQGQMAWQDLYLIWKHPTSLPGWYIRCTKGLTTEHSVHCKKGSLVNINHDDMRDKLAHLCNLALSDSLVIVEPTIFYGNDTNPGQCPIDLPLGNEAGGDVLTQGTWQHAHRTVFDISICDIDAQLYGTT